MFTSIATCSISGTLEAKLRAIAHAGFDGVEIFENDLLTSQKSAREIGAILREGGGSPPTHGAGNRCRDERGCDEPGEDGAASGHQRLFCPW